MYYRLYIIHMIILLIMADCHCGPCNLRQLSGSV